ncbi:MAG: hypothetical protein Q4A16_07615 [Lautropia sp.]|nr:hypothetical protein [Lautropia sp.]
MGVLSLFEGLKSTIEGFSHMQRDALHVHVGLVLFIVFSAVFRGGHRFRTALVLVTAICFMGEAFDAFNRLSRDRPIYWLGSLKDVVNTLLWPCLFYFCGPWIAKLLGFELSLKMPAGPAGPAGPAPQTRLR